MSIPLRHTDAHHDELPPHRHTPHTTTHATHATTSTTTTTTTATTATSATSATSAAAKRAHETLPEMAMFSTRRPKDLVAGTSSAIKSFTKGVACGTVGLFAAPIVGAQQGGFNGFCSGLASGLLGAVALPVAAASIGAMQIARGAYNSFEAIHESASGKDWDQERRQWYEYNLQKDADDVRSLDEHGYGGGGGGGSGGGGGGAARGGGPPPKDTGYYELLGVAYDAPTETIKRAYYRRALKLHPDKNPGDDEAKEQFQRISEAYQVLADDKARGRYDRHGAKSVEGNNIVDAGVFFTMLFGSERFEPYIGTLALASAASMEGNLSMQLLGVKQRKREVACALHLANLLDVYAADEAAFRARVVKEAAELAEVSFGDCLLFTIAEIYSARAAEVSGYRETFLGVGGHLASLRAKKLSLENHTAAAGAGLRAAGAAYRTFRKVKELSVKQGEAGDAGVGGAAGSSASGDPVSGMSQIQLQATQESLPVFLEAMWHISVVDIERTLLAVTHKVCKDHSVDEKSRQQRAEALALLGELFMQTALTSGGSKDPKSKVADMVKVITGSMAGGAGAGAGAEGAEQEPPPPAPTADELRSMGARQLKRLLVECGHAEAAGACLEREELVALAIDVLAER